MRRTFLVIAVIALLAAGGAFFFLREHAPDIDIDIPVSRGCQVRTGSGVVWLRPEQMANAATIAAVGISRSLPDRAVVVALATALQESELVNLAGGDRDSVGLFQQRPSQGWGSIEEINDPRYASRAFYNKLVTVYGWEQLRVTEAAQQVQRSAFPEAYDKWVDEATVLTEALVGDQSGAVSCSRGRQDPALRGDEAATALGTLMRLDWEERGGTSPASAPAGLTLDVADARAGWQYAHWLVSHALDHGVEQVRFGGLTWNADNGEWSTADQGGDNTRRVFVDVYPSE